MAGTRQGGKKAAKTIEKKYGKDFYEKIGQEGGSSQGKENNAANFANDRQKAREAGKKGGSR